MVKLRLTFRQERNPVKDVRIADDLSSPDPGGRDAPECL
jgi:hypothetical protein